MNSSFDGISDQGEGGLYVKDCTIENCAMHGVHMGTVFADAIISGNTMTGNGVRGAGVFFCQDVTNILVENNQITSFNHGCSDEEYGTEVKYALIRNNTFSNITSYVFDFLMASYSRYGGGLQILDNTIERLNDIMLYGDYLQNVIFTGNTVRSISHTPSSLVKVTSSKNVIISGNTVSSGSVSNPVVTTSSSNVINNSNSWN